MTGKEALKLAQDTILAHNGNNKSSFTMKNLYLVEKELDKYKRAFEILKRHNLSIGKNANTETGYYIHCESELLTDEYELLEELMNNE